jgi:hypothetical protein
MGRGMSKFTYELLRQAEYQEDEGRATAEGLAAARAMILAALVIEDLLAALKELAAASYPHWANNHSPSATEIMRLAEAWRMARAAITKTEEAP